MADKKCSECSRTEFKYCEHMKDTYCAYCGKSQVAAKKDITIIWNTAVSQVGSKYNTIENFRNIAKRFSELAAKEEFSDREINEEVKSNYDALSNFFFVTEGRMI